MSLFIRAPRPPRDSPTTQILHFWRLLCLLFAARTARPCVRSPSPLAPNAAQRYSGHPRLCCFHARKEAQAYAQVGQPFLAVRPLGRPTVTPTRLKTHSLVFKRGLKERENSGRFLSALLSVLSVSALAFDLGISPSNRFEVWCEITPFRINTCESVSKQRTLTPFRINTYKKPGEGGSPRPYSRTAVQAVQPYTTCEPRPRKDSDERTVEPPNGT
jgi:hypothetical protein